MPNQKVEKWIRWIDAIAEDVQGILAHRQVYDGVGDLVRDNTAIQKPSAFYDLVGQGYTALAVMAIRRQTKVHKDSVSLAGLLSEIEESPECLTLEWYRAQYPDDDPQVTFGIVEKTFADLTLSSGDHIDPAVPAADLAEFKAKVEAIEEFADRQIAHLDRRMLTGNKGSSTPATYQDLTDCLDHLEGVVLRYYRLLKVISISTFVPSIVYDWQEVFDVPWRQK